MVKGINLVEKIIEFVELTPKNIEWNFESLKDYPSILLRLKQIESLLIAFKLRDIQKFSIEEDIKNILNGQFYENTELSEKTISFIHTFLKKKNVDEEYLTFISNSQINFIFPKILNYKILSYKILNFNSGWLECSPRFNLAYFHILMVDEINENIKDKFLLLDEIIELIINPNNIELTEEFLAENFNYISEAELHKIDLDHI